MSHQSAPLLSAGTTQLLQTTRTVTTVLADSPPGTAVSAVVKELYGSLATESSGEGSGISSLLEKLHLKKTVAPNPLISHDQLAEVKGCGQWGAADPSELFLQVYARALLALQDDPLSGMVSPSLMGSCGVVPLTIISVIPDIIQHHADVIVRAEKEIFLATNYWEASGAAEVIVNAFKELSRRVVAGKREPVVIKLMYDRGNPSQLVDAHQVVPPKTYHGDKVKLPLPDEIPGCKLEVQNFHVPPVGTFHSKYMVVDRKVAIMNSNNIQDRVNVEMMCHIEGPIVQSFYDMALLSWWKAFDPPLPLLSFPPHYTGDRSLYSFGKAHPVLGAKDVDTAASHARDTLAKHHADTEEYTWDESNEDEADRVDGRLSSERSVSEHLNTGTKISATDRDPPPNASVFKPIFLHSPHEPVPMALVNRHPRGRPGHGDTMVPQDQAWLAAFELATSNVFIQTPTFNAKPAVEAAIKACQRGILVEIYADLGFNDEGELLPYQGGTNQMVVMDMHKQLGEQGKNLKWYWYTGKDQKTPLNAKDKSRNCHVKLMIVDGHVGIQGNGNQDTQSWFHSQEINIMVDSKLICSEWREAIDSNQNTKYYGLVDADGIWRDSHGQELPGSERAKIPKGPFKSLAGVKGAIQRVRGEGGF